MDDEDEYEDEYASEIGLSPADQAAKERGVTDRAFFDDLAKQEDVKRRKMEIELQQRSMALGELRQKLSHKQKDLRAVEDKIAIESARLELIDKKAYQKPGGAVEEARPQTLAPDISADQEDHKVKEEAPIPIHSDMKELLRELEQCKTEFAIMNDKVQEEGRELSQLEYTMRRM